MINLGGPRCVLGSVLCALSSLADREQGGRILGRRYFWYHVGVYWRCGVGEDEVVPARSGAAAACAASHGELTDDGSDGG